MQELHHLVQQLIAPHLLAEFFGNDLYQACLDALQVPACKLVLQSELDVLGRTMGTAGTLETLSPKGGMEIIYLR